MIRYGPSGVVMQLGSVLTRGAADTSLQAVEGISKVVQGGFATAVSLHLLPLGLNLSLSSDARLHGYAPLRLSGKGKETGETSSITGDSEGRRGGRRRWRG